MSSCYYSGAYQFHVRHNFTHELNDIQTEHPTMKMKHLLVSLQEWGHYETLWRRFDCFC